MYELCWKIEVLNLCSEFVERCAESFLRTVLHLLKKYNQNDELGIFGSNETL